LQQSKEEYYLNKNNLIKALCETYCMEQHAAKWIVHIFGLALGYETEPLLETTEETRVLFTPLRHTLVALGKTHAAAVAPDGTVYANGANLYYQCDVRGWQNIVAVAAGGNHTVGLQADGRLVATGANTYDQCDVDTKKNVASVYAFGNETICVHMDGTVSATGNTLYDFSMFENIASITRYPEGILGIKEDGTVMATGHEWDDDIKWLLAQTDVAQVIATYVNGIIVLKKDGKLYKNDQPTNYFAPWRDIVSMVDAADSFAVLRKDGAVRLLPYDRDKTRVTCDAEHWENIIALYGRYKRLIGLTADGQLLSACTDPEWQKRNGSFDFVKSWYPIGV
jgi:hypothetical protein